MVILITSLTFSKPTGGVILLEDTRPDEAKSLLELKAKKKTAAAAPAPGAGPAQSSRDVAMSDFATGNNAEGASSAAGVLTAVDEDEDGEEAPVPDEFEVDEDDAEVQE
jgi:26S proteasome regulatory subunit N2